MFCVDVLTVRICPGDGKRRDQGIASGARILSTDYRFDWKAEGSGYSVTLGAEKYGAVR